MSGSKGGKHKEPTFADVVRQVKEEAAARPVQPQRVIGPPGPKAKTTTHSGRDGRSPNYRGSRKRTGN